MKKNQLAWTGILAPIVVVACSGAAVPQGEEAASQEAPLAASSAAGAIPSALPSRLTVGLFEEKGKTWMSQSGVKWDTRYAYFVKGWLDNFGYGAADGQFALDYMKECDAQGTVPVIEYYVMNGESPAYNEGAFYSKTQNAQLMAEYWNEVKVLFQRAKQFGKPVVLLLEADGFAYMQQQSGNNPNAYAAVAASGVPELAGLPNTVAGWGLGFLQMRKAMGATNVTMGPSISDWASGVDVMMSPTASLQPEVDKVYNFMAPLGLAANATGATYDFLVGDPSDRDADYYRLVRNEDRWWDTSDTASTSSKSFNRFAEWLHLWNQKSARRWFLWQIPLGNSNHLNVANSGQPRQGWKDNRPEYFFGAGRDAHLAKFADAGVMGLLFGAGQGDQASFTNDTYTDGQLFMKSRAGAFLSAGGLAIARGGSAGGGGTTDAGTTTDSGTTADSGTTTPPASDPAQYGFESGAQGWTVSGGGTVASTTATASAGTHSLAVNISGAAGPHDAQVAAPATPAGRTVTFHVQCPAGSGVTSVQPFVLQGAAGNWAWTGNWQSTSSLKAGAWNTLTVTVPSNAATPLSSLGVEFTTGSAWTGTCYVDSVGW